MKRRSKVCVLSLMFILFYSSTALEFVVSEMFLQIIKKLQLGLTQVMINKLEAEL